jgi:hypothetical protein
MIEFISVILAELVGVVVAEWLFGGLLRGISWIGYRLYSLFIGKQDVPVSALRKGHDDSIWPWVIVFCLFVGFPALIVALR